MTTVTITITTPPNGSDEDATWGALVDAIDRCTPTNKDLPVAGEWSGDVDAYANGFGIRIVVDTPAPAPEPSDEPEAAPLDTLDEFVAAVQEVGDLFTRVELQKGVLVDARKVGDEAQIAFSTDRIAKHEAALEIAQARLQAAQIAWQAVKGYK
jgi:hypothetical protein